MYYQLPTGKVVQMSIEDYLNLTHRDIQYLLSINAGEYIHNPWTDSAISRIKKEIVEEIIDEEEIIIFENAEEIETFFEEYFPEDFDDPEIKIDIDFDV
jgi:uncharacterized membrane-anchored protein